MARPLAAGKAIGDARLMVAGGVGHPYSALGIAYKYYGAPKGVKYKEDYEGLGRVLWRMVRWQVYATLCKNGAPRFWATEMVGGDIRELVVNIAVLLAAKLDVTLGLAVPLAALAAKRGLKSFCARPPKAKERVKIQTVLKEKLERGQTLSPPKARPKRPKRNP